MRHRLMILAVIPLLLAVPSAAQPNAPASDFGDLGGLGLDPAQPAEKLTARVIPSHTVVEPNQTVHLAVEMTIADGWAFYSPAPGENVDAKGNPVRVGAAEIAVDAGPWSVGQRRWPTDEKYVSGQFVNYVYKGTAVAYVPVTVSPSATQGFATVQVTLSGQVCSPDSCLNAEVALKQRLRVGDEAVPNPDWSEKLTAGLDEALTAEQLRATHPSPASSQNAASGAAQDAPAYSVLGGIALALLAGLALNVMPCVLPVIPLRLLSIVEMAGESRRRYITLGLAFAVGIVAFFAVFAALSAAFAEVLNLSAHFQIDWVRLLMALIVLALAANMFGVFNVVVPSKLAAAEGKFTGGGHMRSLGMGLMMAVLSTPCSFGILAGVMLWAQTQPTWLAAAAVLAVGVGMAAPHVVLAAMPSLIQKLPKPGPWMEHFKHAMGFIMLLVAVWLFSTFAGEAYPFWLVGFGVVFVMGLWIWAGWVRYDAPLGRKLVVRGIAVALVVAAGLVSIPRPAPPAVPFEPFSPARLAEAKQGDAPVVVKFTASWCIKCIQLEMATYDDPTLAAELASRDVVLIKADVTQDSSPAARFLEETVGGAPPLTLVYPAGGQGQPQRLVGTYTRQELLDALDKASQ
ncbi:MAG: cytochrome c biogenesis protein CcdA [Phycisphaerae bacterium]